LGAYTQPIKELRLEGAQRFRNFARKSAVEVGRIAKILASQAEYINDENNFRGHYV
jgi:hypothetical protein